MGDAAAGEAAEEGADDRLLPHHLGEALRAEAAGGDLVVHLRSGEGRPATLASPSLARRPPYPRRSA